MPATHHHTAKTTAKTFYDLCDHKDGSNIYALVAKWLRRVTSMNESNHEIVGSSPTGGNGVVCGVVKRCR